MKTSATNKAGVGAAAPLLPKLKPLPTEGRAASVAGAVFNVSTSIIGAGIMSIPATLKVHNCGESKTYAGVMYESFGRLGSVAVQICVMGTSCQEVSLMAMGRHTWAFGRMVWDLLVELARLCSTLCPRFRFASTGAVSESRIIEIQFSGFGSACCGFRWHMLRDGDLCITGRENKEAQIGTPIDNGASFFNLFTAIPVIVTAFTFHFNVHPIAMELGKPADMAVAVKISLILCAAIYFAVGIFGYILFGDSLMADMLVNFDQNSYSAVGSLLNDVVRLSYALHLMLVFPLLNFSLRANIDEFLFPKKPPLATDKRRFVALTLILLVCSYLAAVAIPNI
ncbi:hypothetical protein C3L33_02952, partial [Rhododendron williamsianum]